MDSPEDGSVAGLQRRLCALLTLCGNQVCHCLRLCQVHLPVEERTTGKFPRLRCSGSGVQTGSQSALYQVDSTVAADFCHILSGVAFGCAVNKYHCFVDFPLPVMHPAKQTAVSGRILCLLTRNRCKYPVHYLQGIWTGHPHHPDSSCRNRRRNRCDCILSHCAVHGRSFLSH